MTNNLWQILNRDDLLFHLRNGKNKIIVLSLVLLNTDQNIKTMIRKYIKRKAEEFSNIIFLYYVVRNEDIGRVGTLIPKDLEKYPTLYHIYNVTELLGEVTGIDDTKLIDQSFKRMNEYYKNFDPNKNNVQTDNNPSNPSNPSNIEDNDNNYDDNNKNDDNDDIDKITEANTNANRVSNPNMTNEKFTSNQPQTTDDLIVNPVLEKKKKLEKIALMKKKSDEYMAKFYEELAERKKNEEKNEIYIDDKKTRKGKKK